MSLLWIQWEVAMFKDCFEGNIRVEGGSRNDISLAAKDPKSHEDLLLALMTYQAWHVDLW